MIFKSSPSLRTPRSEPRRQRSDAGAIVIMMMALVFVPVASLHLASIWQEELFKLPQLAALGSMLHGIF
jgi:hypothetical protein